MNKSQLVFCCGVVELGDFDHNLYPIPSTGFSSGTGLAIATFINNRGCHEYYKALKERYNILFQSKPYKNERSGREVFIVVYKKGAV